MKSLPARVETREEILKRRAERLAATEKSDKSRRIAVQVALVSAGRQRVGLPIDALREIVPMTPITPLPGLPRWLLGITHVRGEIIGVVNLAGILGSNDDNIGALAVVNGSGGPLGLAVEAVLGFRDIYDDELSEPIRADAQTPIQAITKDFVTIIDVKRLPIAPGASTAQQSRS